MKIEGGYSKKILEVDLSAGTSRTLDLSDRFILKYMGGRGFGAKLVWDNLTPDLDPLGPENVIVMAPGPLTGTFLPSSGKTAFVSISPATGLYADSNVGGMIGIGNQPLEDRVVDRSIKPSRLFELLLKAPVHHYSFYANCLNAKAKPSRQDLAPPGKF